MLAQLTALMLAGADPATRAPEPPADLSGWLVAVCGLATVLAGAVIYLVRSGRSAGIKEQKTEDLAVLIKAQTDAAATALQIRISGLETQLQSVVGRADERAATIHALERDALKTNDCKACRREVDAAIGSLGQQAARLSENDARGEERIKTLFEGFGRLEGKVDLLIARVVGPIQRQGTGEPG